METQESMWKQDKVKKFFCLALLFAVFSQMPENSSIFLA
jgi:hypothetical protein